jgi:hypothetical protein
MSAVLAVIVRVGLGSLRLTIPFACEVDRARLFRIIVIFEERTHGDSTPVHRRCRKKTRHDAVTRRA